MMDKDIIPCHVFTNHVYTYFVVHFWISRPSNLSNVYKKVAIELKCKS